MQAPKKVWSEDAEYHKPIKREVLLTSSIRISCIANLSCQLHDHTREMGGVYMDVRIIWDSPVLFHVGCGFATFDFRILDSKCTYLSSSVSSHPCPAARHPIEVFRENGREDNQESRRPAQLFCLS